MQDGTVVKVAAIFTIAWLETVALLALHIDGVILTTVVAGIAGLAGYELRAIKLMSEVAENG